METRTPTSWPSSYATSGGGAPDARSRLAKLGLKLPSNLQGLYRCEYEGASLDYEATMKLLKAFNDFPVKSETE